MTCKYESIWVELPDGRKITVSEVSHRLLNAGDVRFFLRVWSEGKFESQFPAT